MRALRIRRGWRQVDVARRAAISPATVSSIERGHLDDVSARALRRLGAALDARIAYSIRLQHGELERLTNAGQAALHESLARYLVDLPGWVHAPEVSFAFYSERGVIDILAFHEKTGSLLIIELKTELVSLEDLLTTMDVRTCHAVAIARSREWVARTVSTWVVFAYTDLNRRRVREHKVALGSAFPANGRAMRGWLRAPTGSVGALSFWANYSQGTAIGTAAMRRRVRKRAEAPNRPISHRVAEVSGTAADRSSIAVATLKLA